MIPKTLETVRSMGDADLTTTAQTIREGINEIDEDLATHLADIVTQPTANKILKLDGKAQYPLSVMGGNVVKNNFSATTDPTTTDDSSKGYSLGSRWININIESEYICLDATTGVAKWIKNVGGNVWFYKEGEEYADLTGGWVDGENISTGGTYQKVKNADHLYILGENNGGTTYVTENLIDFTDFSKIYVEWEAVKTGVNGVGAVLQIRPNKLDNTGIVAYLSRGESTNGRIIEYLDVSEIKASYRMALQVVTNNSTSMALKVYRIWGEK